MKEVVFEMFRVWGGRVVVLGFFGRFFDRNVFEESWRVVVIGVW